MKIEDFGVAEEITHPHGVDPNPAIRKDPVGLIDLPANSTMSKESVPQVHCVRCRSVAIHAEVEATCTARIGINSRSTKIVGTTVVGRSLVSASCGYRNTVSKPRIVAFTCLGCQHTWEPPAHLHHNWVEQ